MPQAKFDAWIAAAHGSPPLDAAAYAALAADHASTNAATFGAVTGNLFHDIVGMRPVAPAPARGAEGT
jgi:hypothetical protein